ncbi:MAG: hypothetical protein LT103_08060 [Burkholderiaceae bacterium]|nr:hypothetical protein [Burkholderiaceae bacterium]
MGRNTSELLKATGQRRIGPRPKARWPNQLEQKLDQGLGSLPQLQWFPTSLLRESFEVHPVGMRVALVLERDEPIAEMPLSFSCARWRQIAAAMAIFAHDRTVFCRCHRRLREYDKFLIGTRLFEAVREWAFAGGMKEIDFGSDKHFKKDRTQQRRNKFDLFVRILITTRLLRAISRKLRSALGH